MQLSEDGAMLIESPRFDSREFSLLEPGDSTAREAAESVPILIMPHA
jgi:hypothetical protein